MDGGPFSQEPVVTLKPGSHTLAARLVTSGSGSTSVAAQFSLGSQTLAFTATTRADVTAPTGTISFPPKISLTDGSTVIMRGTVKDEASTIKSVKINNQAVTSFDADKGTWELKAAALTPGPQVLTLEVEDSAGNKNTRAASVNILQGDTNITFPEQSGVNFVGPQTVAWDNLDGRNRALVMDVDAKALIAVDLNTGKRTVLSDNTTQNDLPFIYDLDGYNSGAVVVDKDKKVAYVPQLTKNEDGDIFSVDLSTGIRSSKFFGVLPYVSDMAIDRANGFDRLFYCASEQGSINARDILTNIGSGAYSESEGYLTPSDLHPFANSGGIAVDAARNRLLMTSLTGRQFVYSIDISLAGNNDNRGARSVFSASNAPDSLNAFTSEGVNVLTSIRVDSERSRALMVDRLKPAVFSLALSDDKTKDGARSVLSDNTKNTANKLAEPYGLQIEPGMPYALLVDKAAKATIAVDLESGERVFISKSK